MFNRNFNLKQTKTSEKFSENAFIKANQMESHVTYELGNKAKKYTTTSNDFVDQFGQASNYKTPREFSEISRDMEVLWSQSPILTLMFTFYLRMITRVTQLWDGSKTNKSQKGQGLKHEGIFRMLWIAVHYPDSFWKNLPLWISIGSWKDIFTMLEYDLESHGWNGKVLDWGKFYAVISAGLENPNTSELVKKYLPQIKSSPKTNRAIARTMIGKWLASELFNHIEHKASRYKQYRKLKVSGTAHEWQQLISQNKMWKINFDTIHGRALAQLVSGNFLKNHGLENKYQEWIESKPTAKYTGYVYELFKPFGKNIHPKLVADYKQKTIDAQFLELVQKAKSKGVTPFLAVLDTSGSMTGETPGTGMSAYTIGKAMTLFMSYLLDGPFANSFFEFTSLTRYREWEGNTPTEKFRNFKASYIGNTNFQSVADEFVRLKRSGVPEDQFPTGIVCFSDGCFNSTGRNQTNFEAFQDKLRIDFSPEFVENFTIVLWDIPNNFYGKSQTSFEGSDTHPGLIHVSGLDPAILSLLTGESQSIPKNSKEMFVAAMEQEVLEMIEL